MSLYAVIENFEIVLRVNLANINLYCLVYCSLLIQVEDLNTIIKYTNKLHISMFKTDFIFCLSSRFILSRVKLYFISNKNRVFQNLLRIFSHLGSKVLATLKK